MKVNTCATLRIPRPRHTTTLIHGYAVALAEDTRRHHAIITIDYDGEELATLTIGAKQMDALALAWLDERDKTPDIVEQQPDLAREVALGEKW